MPTNVAIVKEKEFILSKAKDCIARRNGPVLPALLFDQFWREGELALLFGASGTGKSILAVQLADALARGTPLNGFIMPRGRREVLYVDLNLSKPQFRARYARHKFAERLYRDRPGADEDLFEWIKRSVEENGIRVVVVDDLSAVKRTHDGIRETLALMRKLRRLCAELGASVLVISDSLEPTDGWESEKDLGRSRVLCTVADSVFSIGRKRWPEGGRRLIQRRSRSATLFWDSQNAPVGTIERLPSGLLGFEFDERFSPQMDEEKRRTICDIHSRREAGLSWRAIAAELGISRSWACDLYKKWTPAMKGSQQSAVSSQQEDEEDHWDETEISREASEWLEEESSGSPPYEGGVRREPGGGSLVDEEGEPPRQPKRLPPLLCKEGSFLVDPSAIPFAAGLGRCSIYDLDFGFDAYGNQVFVESRDEYTGKPSVWYQFDAKGNKLRHERGPFGITVEHMNTGPFL